MHNCIWLDWQAIGGLPVADRAEHVVFWERRCNYCNATQAVCLGSRDALTP